MNTTARSIFAVAAIAISVYLLTDKPATAATVSATMGQMYARQITVTATATRVRDLLPTADQQLDGRCNVTIFNPSSTQVNFGGVDVDNTSKFIPICTAATCATDRISINTGILQTALRTTSGTLNVYVIFGGGC